MRSASAPGAAALPATTWPARRAGSGDSDTTFWKSALALRTSACDSRSVAPSSGSAMASTRARRKGSVCSELYDAEPARPWTTRRTLPSGCLSTLWIVIDRADPVESVEGGGILGRIALHDGADEPAALHGILDQADRRRRVRRPAAAPRGETGRLPRRGRDRRECRDTR